MKIINKAARLITINFDGEEYKLMPAGKSVEIPDGAKGKSPFLASLIDMGDVGIVSGDAEETSGDSGESAIDDLRAEAEELGVDVDNRWGESRLKDEIEKALAE